MFCCKRAHLVPDPKTLSPTPVSWALILPIKNPKTWHRGCTHASNSPSIANRFDRFDCSCSIAKVHTRDGRRDGTAGWPPPARHRWDGGRDGTGGGYRPARRRRDGGRDGTAGWTPPRPAPPVGGTGRDLEGRPFPSQPAARWDPEVGESHLGREASCQSRPAAGWDGGMGALREAKNGTSRRSWKLWTAGQQQLCLVITAPTEHKASPALWQKAHLSAGTPCASTTQ